MAAAPPVWNLIDFSPSRRAGFASCSGVLGGLYPLPVDPSPAELSRCSASPSLQLTLSQQRAAAAGGSQYARLRTDARMAGVRREPPRVHDQSDGGAAGASHRMGIFLSYFLHSHGSDSDLDCSILVA